jgi:hypothetical protein
LGDLVGETLGMIAIEPISHDGSQIAPLGQAYADGKQSFRRALAPWFSNPQPLRARCGLATTAALGQFERPQRSDNLMQINR